MEQRGSDPFRIDSNRVLELANNSYSMLPTYFLDCQIDSRFCLPSLFGIQTNTTIWFQGSGLGTQ